MKNPPVSFRGVIPAIASPCDASDNFDEEAFLRLTAALWDEKIQGLYVCGLTGDGYQMTFEERKKAVELAVKSCGERGLIMAHVGTQDTRAACKLAAHAADAGAQGVASIPPIGRSFTEIESYYRELARAAGGLPVFIYHIPVFTKWEATFEQLERLSEIEGVSGIKFTDYNLMLMRRLADMRPDFTVLYGRDEQFAAALALGSHGGVGSTFNVFPRAYAAMQQAIGKGSLDAAFRIQGIVTDAIILMDRFGVVACIEELLARAGLIQFMRRQPCCHLSKPEADEMWGLLKPILSNLPSDAQTNFLKMLS